MKNDLSKTCMGGSCSRCHSGKLLILGLLILVNVYWLNFDWFKFIGGLLVIGGILKLAMPWCPHCK